jgi:translation initiation factor IF-2
MRVHELAKEFGMSSKELLTHLQEMKIPAKGHSSTLVDAYVDKVRKQLGPEIAERAAQIVAKKKAEQAKKAAAERARRAEEATAHKAAVEKERALREAERAQRAQQEGSVAGPAAGASASVATAAPAGSAASTSADTSASVGALAGSAATTPAASAVDVSAYSDDNFAPAASVGVAPLPPAARKQASVSAVEPTAQPVEQGSGGHSAFRAKGPGSSSASSAKGSGGHSTSRAMGSGGHHAKDSGHSTSRAMGSGGHSPSHFTPRARVTGAPGAQGGSGQTAPARAATTKQPASEAAGAQPVRKTAPGIPAIQHKKVSPDTGAPPGADTSSAGRKTRVAGRKPHFSELLSQIEAEKSRIEAEKASRKQTAQRGQRAAGAQAGAKKGVGSTRRGVAAPTADQLKQTGAASPHPKSLPAQRADGLASAGEARFTQSEEGEVKGTRKPKNRRGGKGQPERFDDSISGRSRRPRDVRKQPASVLITEIYDEDDASEDERYRQMARAAEQLQRERVLAEARAVVQAASDDGGGRRKKRKEKRVAQAKERAELAAIEKGLDPALVLDASVVKVSSGITVQQFADALGIPASDIVKRLLLLGSPLTVAQSMTDELLELIADDLGRKVRIVSPEEEYAVVINDAPEDLKPRPPVVTVMGHVDHGKTSLLDAIRETGVVATEAGGITQHIGASVAFTNDRQITFIDTPGHEAFTAMRARGARLTDVVVLVVAADDGVMPQTVEAIHHAKAAQVPIVVAVNKIDRAGATPERVRQELTEHNIIPEEWGGQNMFVDVSARQRTGIDDLLEAIILQADVLELKANPSVLASGFVIEAKLDKGRGPIATVLVQRGTLKVGDAVVMGTSYGRVRALINPLGENVMGAQPSYPVEILGLNSVPDAGDEFQVFAEERDARNLAEDRSLRQRLAEQQKSHVSLEDLFQRIEQDKLSELNLVVKADAQGSIEALKDALQKMDQSEVRINVIHSAVGGISETDINLAAASDAVIIGFNVRPTAKARQLADRERVEIKTYKVIYQAIEDINAARVGLLAPERIERDTGIAEVRELFRVPKVGTIAGCMVVEGEISRNDRMRVVRSGAVVYDGRIASLRHFKENVNSVKAGFECGIGIDGFQDVKIGDTLEGYTVSEVARAS